MEIGTLKELDVKPGDVVECVDNKRAVGDLRVGNRYFCHKEGTVRDEDGEDFPWTYAQFRVVSRTSDTPKLWRDMTDEEKGALLLAAHEGKVIEVFETSRGDWARTLNMIWYGWNAYRVKPEPVRETVTIYTGWPARGGWSQDMDDDDTHRITFDLIDGKPDCTSIKMEKL